MTDLTEKWKAGELEKGAYYVKDKRGNVYIDEYDDEYSCGYYQRTCFSSDDVYEILSPVPSFEEWQDGIFNFNILKMSLNGFEKRERRLKELLKECQEIIEWYKADCGYKDLPTESVLTKIEEVLK